MRHVGISIAAVSAQSCLMDLHLDEAEFAWIVLERGEWRTVLRDSTRLKKTALVRVTGFDQIDLLIIDRTLSLAVSLALTEAGAHVQAVDG